MVRPVSVHHIQLSSEGGTDHIDNGIALCPNCHDEVHALAAPGRVTRQYTTAELKGHRQLTIELVAQSILQSGQAMKGPLSLVDLRRMVADTGIAIARCCVEGLEVAQTIGSPSLERFCQDELTGYKRLRGPTFEFRDDAASIGVEYRCVDAYFCAGKIDPMLVDFLGGREAIRRMKADPQFKKIRMIYPEPIAEIEMLASRVNERGMLEFSMSLAALLPDVENDGTKPLALYVAGDTPRKLTGSIRAEFLRRLLHHPPRDPELGAET